MMDALARLEPIARPLLAEVDQTLATLGAPAEHAVWTALRRVGATPADAVTAVAALDPVLLRTVASGVRARGRDYTAATPSIGPVWWGPAAALYQAQAATIAQQLSTGPQSMAQRLTDLAAYADAVAAWYEEIRSSLAAALAEVLTSAQAVAIRTAADGTLAASISAAADIATHLLDVVAGALAAGEDLPGTWRSRLQRRDFAPVSDADQASPAIDVHHA
jgi:hypothetical protein